MKSAVVIDYGIVNLKNIIRGFEYVGAQVESSIDPDHVVKADRVILPGVGAFESGMNELQALGLDEAVKFVAKAGRPVLGICLGMQMLLDESSEHGLHKGLGLIPGSVEPIPTEEEGERKRKIPHIGWNSLYRPSYARSWMGSCLNNTQQGTFCYFVHSFMAVPVCTNDVLAQCMYQGQSVTAAINRENITGLQFHPERSGPAGLEILSRFMAC
jgi:glutamine amidotransferase